MQTELFRHVVVVATILTLSGKIRGIIVAEDLGMSSGVAALGLLEGLRLGVSEKTIGGGGGGGGGKVRSIGVEARNAVEKDGNDKYEPLPQAQAWKNAPRCPEWGPMDTFMKQGVIKQRYMGRWFLQDKHADLADLSGKCWSQFYSVDTWNKTIQLRIDYATRIGGFSHHLLAGVTIDNPFDANLLTYQMESGYLPSEPKVYRVLATDYETFTIEYSCRDTNLIRRNENIWILTREKKPTRSVLKRAYKSLKLLGLSGSRLKKADQSCKDEPAEPLPPISRVDLETPPPVRQGPAPITTGELTAKMMSSLGGGAIRAAQVVLAPWTLHPQLGLGGGSSYRKSSRRDFGRRNIVTFGKRGRMDMVGNSDNMRFNKYRTDWTGNEVEMGDMDRRKRHNKRPRRKMIRRFRKPLRYRG